MDAFFGLFSGFTHNPENQPEFEFRRLCAIKGWNPPGLAYKKAHKDFRTALAEETGSAVDRFFLTMYPGFNYQRKASPTGQFRQLERSRGWDVEWELSDEHKHARDQFEDAYDQEFIRDVDGFFNDYPDFDYNPRNEAKSEFEKLRRMEEWSFPDYLKDQLSVEERVKKSDYMLARHKFFTAFVRDFTYFFGTGEDTYDWKYLCSILQINPTPRTIGDCRSVSHFDLTPRDSSRSMLLASNCTDTSILLYQHIQPIGSRATQCSSGSPCR